MLLPVVFLCLFRGIYAGFSAFAGGVACWLPTLAFSRLVFARLRSGKSFLAVFMTGELVRLVGSAVLFVGVLKYVTKDAVSAACGFVAAIIAFWVSSLFQLVRGSKRELRA